MKVWYKLFFIRKSDRYALLFIILAALTGVTVGVILDQRSGKVSRWRGRQGGDRIAVHATAPSKGGYAQQDVGYGDGSQAYDGPPNVTLFPFDPNTADSTTLLRLGLKPWMVRNIYRYRARGGRYRRPEDFARVYGMTLAHYRMLEPYIRIRPDVMAADVVRPAERGHTHTAATVSAPPTKPAKLTLDDDKVDVNSADTTLLKRIPGIGPYFARRIVELRERRGVFVSTDELLAIRDFPEAALPYMVVADSYAPIHINTMTMRQLRCHPLINNLQARDICALRRISGPIRSMADMEFVKSFSAAQLRRIGPFVRFD